MKEHVRKGALLRVDGLVMTLPFCKYMVDRGIGNLHVRSEEDFAAGRVGTRSNLEMAHRNTCLHFDLPWKCTDSKEYSFNEQEEKILNAEVVVPHVCVNLLLGV